jgi:hypothetical protein
VPEPQVAEEPVRGKGGLAEDLREFPPREAPLHLHLEQAVLRVAEPLGEIQVVVVRRGDVRYAETVPDDFDGGDKARRGERPVPLRDACAEKGAAGRQQEQKYGEGVASRHRPAKGRGALPGGHRFGNARAFTRERIVSNTSPE